MTRVIFAAALLSLAVSSVAMAQSITTEQDQLSGDAAEIAALAKEANGDVYSLPPEKKMRVATLELKYFIRTSFADPDTVKAVIIGDPHHVDLKVWQGLLNGGNKTYSGMAICARINARNRFGAYTGDVTYLVIANGDQRTGFSSPYYNTMFNTTMVNPTVVEQCR